MNGVPMGVIAAQRGHADTRMTEKHYAHLAPSYVAQTSGLIFQNWELGPTTVLFRCIGRGLRSEPSRGHAECFPESGHFTQFSSQHAKKASPTQVQAHPA